jgi:hypothetical protein
MAALPVAIAPAAQAEVCGAVGGRHVDVGGCTHVVGDVAAGVALANDDDWAVRHQLRSVVHEYAHHGGDHACGEALSTQQQVWDAYGTQAGWHVAAGWHSPHRASPQGL